MNTPAFSTSNTKRLGIVHRDAVAVGTQEVIKTSFLNPTQTLPLVIEPRLDGVSLSSWASNKR